MSRVKKGKIFSIDENSGRTSSNDAKSPWDGGCCLITVVAGTVIEIGKKNFVGIDRVAEEKPVIPDKGSPVFLPILGIVAMFIEKLDGMKQRKMSIFIDELGDK